MIAIKASLVKKTRECGCPHRGISPYFARQTFLFRKQDSTICYFTTLVAINNKRARFALPKDEVVRFKRLQKPEKV